MTSDRARWEALARSEPYFSVLSERRYLSEALTPESRRAFFETGEAYVESLLRLRQEELQSADPPHRVLEFGCGPGRLAIAFARRGLAVTAVDVSETMLSVARANALEQGIRNIELETQERFFEQESEFELISLHFMLQHVVPADGLRLLEQLLKRLSRRGTIHIHVPFRDHRSGGARALSLLRDRLPGANAVANRLRGKPADTPFLPAHVYSLDDVLSRLLEARVEPKVIRLTRDNELEVAVVSAIRLRSAAALLTREATRPSSEEGEARPDRAAPGMIQVQQLIRETSIEELNRRAEQYFAGLTSWETQIAKPFATPADSPPMLVNLAVLIQGMRLVRGLKVLEFGAGTGWLGRILMQLGCEVILLDVSATALKIAAEELRRVPAVGNHAEPRFLQFDGYKIDLPDQSVDRIVCFDSFHHAPNPDDVLREFARVLVPRGIAAFAEPGPEHSLAPQSQFEMRAYGVIENDIDIHAIGSLAQKIGFSEMRVAAFSGSPLFLRADEFEDLLAGGSTADRLTKKTRDFLGNVRTFFLDRAGSGMVDSRSTDSLSCRIEARLVGSPRAGQPIRVQAKVMNTGLAAWLPSEQAGGVSLGCHLYAGDQLVELNHHWAPIPDPPAPGQTTEWEFDLPPLPAGAFELEFDCVARDVAWFGQLGAATTTRVRALVLAD